jgi:hypothetical protein
MVVPLSVPSVRFRPTPPITDDIHTTSPPNPQPSIPDPPRDPRSSFVTPAQAGVQRTLDRDWIPAYAGMTRDERPKRGACRVAACPTSSFAAGLLPLRWRPGVALEAFDEVAQSHDRVPREHARSGVAHHRLDAPSHLGLIAVHLALRAGPLVHSERTRLQPCFGVLKQFRALGAKLPARPAMVPRTIHPHHHPNRRPLPFQTLSRCPQSQTVLSHPRYAADPPQVRPFLGSGRSPARAPPCFSFTQPLFLSILTKG